MAFHCKDCSYRGISSGQDGSCPACGSFNVSGRKVEEPAPGKYARLRLALLVCLWLYIAILIIWKLSH
jgi:hypothetical protein